MPPPEQKAPIFTFPPTSLEANGGKEGTQPDSADNSFKFPTGSANEKQTFDFAKIPSFGEMMGNKGDPPAQNTNSESTPSKAPSTSKTSGRITRNRKAPQRGGKGAKSKPIDSKDSPNEKAAPESAPVFSQSSTDDNGAAPAGAGSSKNTGGGSIFNSVPKAQFSGFFPSSGPGSPTDSELASPADKD